MKAQKVEKMVLKDALYDSQLEAANRAVELLNKEVESMGIKPGYKKKIQWKVDEKRKRERRAANRAKERAERKAKKQSF